MVYLLNYRSLAGWISFVIAILLVWFVLDGVDSLYTKIQNTLSGTAFTMLGFLLASVTLLLTIQDRPFVVEIKRHRPEIWNQVISEFFSTTYLFGIIGLLTLFLSGQTIYQDIEIYRRIFLGSMTFLVLLSIIQVAKIIYLLRVLSKN